MISVEVKMGREWFKLADFTRQPDARDYIQSCLLTADSDCDAFDIRAIKIDGELWADYLERAA